MAGSPTIRGFVAPGFEPVREAFIRNFEQRGELGSGCAAVLGGRSVVDLWGGIRDAATREPWEEDTLSLIFSTTKGIAAAAMAMAHARGWLKLDERIARYWPEFAQAGKGWITVRHLLMHQAGLAVIKDRLTPQLLADPASLAVILARQRAARPAGNCHGYHGVSLGFFLNELMRLVDPQGRTIGQFVREEINPVLNADLHIGLPRDLHPSRVAAIQSFHPLRALFHVRTFPPLAVAAMMWPWSSTFRSLMNPRLSRPGDLAGPRYRHLELPSANGLATARGLAALFGELALGGRRLGLDERTFAELTTRPSPPAGGCRDRIVHMDLVYSSFGFFMSAPTLRFGRSGRAFGSPGAGGTFAFAEPDLGLGYAYTTNRMGFYLFNDPREKSLRDAVMRCLQT